MKVFAISDPHLALSAPYVQGQKARIYKPMDIFGQHWQGYYQHLYHNWQQAVGSEDVVLMPGDISWAMTWEEAQYDFAYLAALPGRIVIVKGNHDYWWPAISRLRAALPANIQALQHSSMIVAGRAVCGSRGWLTPDNADFGGAEDKRIYARELLRLRMALEEGQKSGLPLVAMLHFPPVSQLGQENEMLNLLREFEVSLCVYGHIHGQEARHVPEGRWQGIEFVNVSCDRIGFTPRLLWQE